MMNYWNYGIMILDAEGSTITKSWEKNAKLKEGCRKALNVILGGKSGQWDGKMTDFAISGTAVFFPIYYIHCNIRLRDCYSSLLLELQCTGLYAQLVTVKIGCLVHFSPAEWCQLMYLVYPSYHPELLNYSWIAITCSPKIFNAWSSLRTVRWLIL